MKNSDDNRDRVKWPSLLGDADEMAALGLKPVGDLGIGAQALQEQCITALLHLNGGGGETFEPTADGCVITMEPNALNAIVGGNIHSDIGARESTGARTLPQGGVVYITLSTGARVKSPLNRVRVSSSR